MQAGSEPRGRGYAIVDPRRAANLHDGTDVPGEFRQLTEALGAQQLAVTMIRVPPHADFDRGTGHVHEEIEEIYLITRGTLTMRLGVDVVQVRAPSVVRVDPQTPRSHRNETGEPVEMWALSRNINRSDSTKIPGFWPPAPEHGPQL